MKKIITAILLIVSNYLAFGQREVGLGSVMRGMQMYSDIDDVNAHYINYNNVIYRLNEGNNTAGVVNFKTNTPIVTIPSTFYNEGERYTVTWIGYYDNFRDKRDLDNARAKIKQLNLPNTIKEVTNINAAFQGMVRLESLVLPPIESIDLHLPYLPRLQKLVVKGNPKIDKYHIDNWSRGYGYEGRFFTADSLDISDYRIISNTDSQGNAEEKYIRKDVDYVSTAILLITDSYKAYDGSLHSNCPDLKSWSMPDAEKIIAQLKPRKNQYDKYRKQLSDYIDMYESKLKENPFYDEEDSHFNLSELPMTYNYRNSQATIDKEFANSKKKIESEYNLLMNGEMKQNLKKNNPEKYVSVTRSNNPIIAAKLDSVLNEYRCQSEESLKISLAVIDNEKILLKPCREIQYSSYKHLFDSKEEFNSSYFKAKTDGAFLNEIEVRQGVYKKLYGLTEEEYVNLNKQQFSRYNDWRTRAANEYKKQVAKGLNGFESFLQKNGKSLDLCGAEISSKENLTYTTNVIKECKQSFYYNRALDMVFEYCPKVKKEYDASAIYFSSKDDFYNCYIKADYSKILKDRKKEYKSKNR